MSDVRACVAAETFSWTGSRLWSVIKRGTVAETYSRSDRMYRQRQRRNPLSACPALLSLSDGCKADRSVSTHGVFGFDVVVTHANGIVA